MSSQNNISSVAYQIYEPLSSYASAFTGDATDVELALRNEGYLIHHDSSRRAIWSFRLVENDGSSTGLSTLPGSNSILERCGIRLKLVDEGGFEPASVMKSKSLGMKMNTPNSTSSGTPAWELSASNALLGAASSQGSTASAFENDPKATAQFAQEATKSYGTISAKDAHDCFVSAALSSLSACFCARTGAIALTPTSVLLPREENKGHDQESGQTPPVAATLRLYLTTTGSLVISIAHSFVPGLMVSAGSSATALPPSGTSILAAPFGRFSTFLGAVDGDHPTTDVRTVQSPDMQLSRLRLDGDEKVQRLRKACMKVLALKGVRSATLHKTAWFNIRDPRQNALDPRYDSGRSPLVTPSATVLWPSSLCFWKCRRSIETGRLLMSSLDSPEGFDFLGSAQTWFLGEGERDDTMARRIKSRDKVASRDVDEATAQNSPLALRRPSNHGPTAGMYPTPPDGVNPVGATPSFDGNVSSPGHPSSTAAIADIDTVMTQAPSLDPFHESWDHDSKPPDRRTGSLPGDSENMFGDLGADFLAEDDITDADFNFFDEEPGPMNMTDFPAAAVMEPPTLMGPPASIKKDPQPDVPVVVKSPPKVAPALPPVFAKPELRHARSTMGDDGSHSSSTSHPRPSGNKAKRPPSPFNPETVYKRVKASFREPSPARNSSVSNSTPARRRAYLKRLNSTQFSP